MMVIINCLFVCCITSKEHASVSTDLLRQLVVHAATLRQKLQIKLTTSLNHSILTPGQSVPVLTLYCQAPGRVATGVSIFKSLE